MTLREQAKSIATQKVVRHIREYGPAEDLEGLAWECLEGACETSEDGRRYIASANDRGLDRLCSEVANRAERSLNLSGLRARVR